MNQTQRLVLSLGAGFLGVMTLVPPWQRVKIVGLTDSPNTHRTNAGYRLVFSPPEERDGWEVSYRIDWSRRLAEYLAVAGLIAAVCVGVGDRGRQPTGPTGAAGSPGRSAGVPSATVQPTTGAAFLWAPSGAAQFAAMFVEVSPGPPPTRERYLSMLGAKWDRMLSEEPADSRSRFIGRTQSLFTSLPEPDSRSSFFADGREVLARDEWGSVLVGNDEVQEVLSGQGLLAGMNQPVSLDWHERLSDHGMPDLESILTVLENAEPSMD